MTSTPHDALFKAGFESPDQAAGVFRAVLPPALVAAIDWDSLTCIPGAFIDPALGERRTDLLFCARLRDRELLLYLVLEHQSTVDPDMPLRMLIYMVRIWERHRKLEPSGPLPLVVSTLLSHAPGGWTPPTSLHALFDPEPSTLAGIESLIPQFSLVVTDLIDLDDDAIQRLLLAPFPKLVLWVLRDGRAMPTLLESLPAWVDALSDLLQSQEGMDAFAQLIRYVFLVGGRSHYEAFRDKLREHLPPAEDAMETIAEWLHERGRTQGRQEGHLEGRLEGHLEGRRQLFATLLSAKFGELPPAHVARITAANDDELERWIRHVFEAETLDAVFDA